MTTAGTHEPRWVRADAVRAIHRRQISEHGGADGIRSEALLDSALHRPVALWRYGNPPPDLPSVAATYAYGVGRNQPFVDGNKRVAYVVCRLFLELNGEDIDASREQKYATFTALAEGRLTEDALAEWIRGHLAASPSQR